MEKNWNIVAQPLAAKYDLIELVFNDEQDFKNFAVQS